MTTNEQIGQREYAVIAKDYNDLNLIYSDLENHGCGDNNCCPERIVSCSVRKPLRIAKRPFDVPIKPSLHPY